jgi:hypothetical protein
MWKIEIEKEIESFLVLLTVIVPNSRACNGEKDSPKIFSIKDCNQFAKDNVTANNHWLVSRSYTGRHL